MLRYIDEQVLESKRASLRAKVKRSTFVAVNAEMYQTLKKLQRS